MSEIDTLYVVWQEPNTSRYFPVGRFRTKGATPEQVYEFVYTRGAELARTHGFDPFLAFPDVGKEYLSTHLFPFFANRLLPLSREDYREHIGRLGLSPDTASAMEVLARSGGRRVTDSIELFAPPQSQESADEGRKTLDYLFLVHGTRHMRECARLRIEKDMSIGDPLFLVHDLQNRVDPKALTLRTGDYCCVGFIPRFLLGDVWALFEDGGQMNVTVEQINPPPAPVQQRILCKLSAVVGNHFLPCSGDEFRTMVHESRAT